MFLSKFLGRLSILNQNQKRKSSKNPKKVRSKTNKDQTLRSPFNTAAKKESKRSSLPIVKDIDTTRQLNEQLAVIEKRIKSKGSNNDLLLKKGELLLQKGKYKQSRKVLNEIIESKNNRQSSRSARELISLSQQLQKSELIENLHKTGNIYNHTLINPPKNPSFSSDLEITNWVRDEARRARSAGLPKLSHELIDLTLNTVKQPSSLLLGKALSLNMIGRKKEALEILKKLQKEAKDKKVIEEANKTIESIKKNPVLNQFKVNKYLAMQCNALAKASSFETKFIPDLKNIEADAKLKSLIYKEAIVCFDENPNAALSFINSILDYFPKDAASLQLKGEILCTLGRGNEALPIWKNLAISKDENIAVKAQESITAFLSKKATQISVKKTPREALLFYIDSSLKYNNSTNINNKVMRIIAQADSSIDSISDPELRKHHMQLQYNNLVIDYFEEKVRKKAP